MKRKSKIFDLSAISIVACDSIQCALLIFIDLFLISNVLKDVNYDISYKIIQIGLFYIIYYGVLGTSYLFTGYYLKNHNKSVFVSIGAFGFTAVVVLIYFLRDNLVTFLPIIALLYGLSFSFYSPGYHNLTSETISSKHQVRFFAIKRIVVQLVYVLFPVVFGLIDEHINFSVVIIIMAVLCVALVVFSFLIKPKKVFKLSFNLRKYGRYLKDHKQSAEPLKFVYLSNFFRGASVDCFTTLLTILVWIGAQSTSTLGTLQSVFTLVSIITLFLYLRYYRKKRSKTFLFPCFILVAISAISIILTEGTNMVAITIFYAVYTILNVIYISLSDSRKASVVRILSLHSHILESTAFMELSLAGGRVFSSLLLVLAGLFDGLIGTNLNIFLLVTVGVVGVLYIFFGLSLYWIERSLIRQDDQFHKMHVNELYEKVED